jgi:RNA polymerase sigma factor (sigma-70 family)
LVEAVAHGEPWAAGALVSLFGPVLVRFAGVIGSDLSQADQELAVEQGIDHAIERIDEYKAKAGSLGVWLRPFVRHAVGDLRRTRGMHEPLNGDWPDQTTDADAPSISDAERSAVHRALLRLSPTDQLIISLRDFERLTYAQCADLLRAAEGTCRVRHHRALQRLREQMANEPALERFAEVAQQ